MSTTTAPAELSSGNPALNDRFVATKLVPQAGTRTMTVAGVGLKTVFLLLVFTRRRGRIGCRDRVGRDGNVGDQFIQHIGGRGRDNRRGRHRAHAGRGRKQDQDNKESEDIQLIFHNT